MIRHLKNFVFPLRCMLCGGSLLDDEVAWCAVCDGALPRYVGESATRFDGRLSWDVSWVLLRHRGAPGVDRLLKAFKYGGEAQVAVEVGRAMARAMAPGSTSSGVLASPALVPVPLHMEKLKSRGYNQAERIAQGCSDITGWPVLELLVRERHGEALAKEDRRGRMASRGLEYRPAPKAQNVLQVSSSGAGPPTILLLIDDVLTSGATMESAWSASREFWHGPLGYACAASP